MTVPPPAPEAHRPSARVLRLHADVRKAAEMVAPLWPLDRFVAVNPLGGLTDLPFEEACTEARRWRGVRTHLDLDTARRLARRAGVGDTELRAALAATVPELSDLPDVVVGERSLSASELALVDVIHGPQTPSPAPLPSLGARATEPVPDLTRHAIDELVAAWCATFIDDHTATWAMSGRHEGLHRAWRRALPHDPRARRILGRRAVKWIDRLPDDPADALDTVLATAGVADDDRVHELRLQLVQLPGWAGHARWHDEWAPVGQPPPRLRLLDLAAVRTSLEVAALLHPDRGPAREPVSITVPPVDGGARQQAEEAASRAALTERASAVCRHLGTEPDEGLLTAVRDTLSPLRGAAREAVWLTAHERRWRDGLLERIAAAPAEAAEAPPSAQVLCCIDVRSEGLRRQLEKLGGYETFGVAGFFGIPVEWQPLGSWQAEPRNPVLITPSNRATEIPAPGAQDDAARAVRNRLGRAAVEDAGHRASHGVGAPFAFAEAAGWFTGPAALARTFRPSRWWRRREGGRPERSEEQLATRPVLDGERGFNLEQRTLLAESLLAVIGLTDGFAPLVVLCGHGAETRNNPHAASLDCGACGGAPGGTSARLAAAICNDPGVRRALEERGIVIPAETWFVAAEHDTVADVVTVLDREQIPRAWDAEVEALTRDLEATGAALAAERAGSQPGMDADLRDRGTDWAQVRPEWGLAGNAAFIVGPRSSTLGVDLQRRTFLHSYRADLDPEGRALETILTAPLIVAQWINAQYLFSTVDQDLLGAGDKMLHNPVAGIGVTLGDGGDLRVGLPLQSVSLGGEPVHEPLRLLAVVEAPLERTADIVQRNGALRALVDNEWITLVGRSRPGEPWSRLGPGGHWEPWTSPATGAGGAPDELVA